MPTEIATTAVSIPTVLWSGAVASFISLAGVILSNRSSLERLREQLQHDAREKHRDRVSELRKQVYIELTTQMTAAQAHLGSLAAKDPTTGELAGPLQTAMAELAKVQLIGTRETAALAGELTAIYGEALFKLIAAAKPMHELQIDIKITTGLYDQQYAQAQRVIAEMTAQNETGTPDSARMDALQRSFGQYRDSYTSYSDERNAAWDSYNALNRSFLQSVLEEVRRISPVQIRLICAIRSEIGLDTDASELLKRLDENQFRMTKALDDLLVKIEPSAKV